MKFSFVIPAYGNYTGLHQLLFDIYKNCTRPYEVLILDDKGDDVDTIKGLTWWSSTGMLPVQHIVNIENLGFLKNSNQGLKMAKGDVVALVSTDVRIHNDITQIDPGENLLGGRLLIFDTGWNTFKGVVYPYVEGWLLTAKKSVWKELGYFDERFAPNDYEDVDLSTTAKSQGREIGQYGDGMTSHGGAHSIGYNPEREALTQRNRKKFEEKWIK